MNVFFLIFHTKEENVALTNKKCAFLSYKIKLKHIKIMKAKMKKEMMIFQ